MWGLSVPKGLATPYRLRLRFKISGGPTEWCPKHPLEAFFRTLKPQKRNPQTFARCGLLCKTLAGEYGVSLSCVRFVLQGSKTMTPSSGAHCAPIELPTRLSPGGLNVTLYSVALRAANRRIPPEETASLLERWNRERFLAGDHHRRVGRDELRHQVRAAYAKVQSSPLTGRAVCLPPPPVAYDLTRQKARFTAAKQSRVGVAELQAASDCAPRTLRGALSGLFAPPELVCLGRSPVDAHPRTLTWGEWSNEDLSGAVVVVVPNPMRAREGVTLEGRAARPRTRANASTRPRWGVLEFDQPDLSLDAQAALLGMFSAMWPLGMAVFSGGKSLHGWFFVRGDLAAFGRDVEWVGGDPACTRPEQFFRAPWGLRDGVKPQSVLFWNWDVINAALRWSLEGGAQ